ncbi:MAG: hypothetical protein ACFFCW_15415 [Candidatus Hodarchaeota archaeon]
MSLQGCFETYIKKIVRLLEGEDPRIVERSTKIPKIEVNLEQELDLSGTNLGVHLGTEKILIPKVPEVILEPLLVKVAFDWLFHPYLMASPKHVHQFSFLMPWFLLKKSEEWLTPWEHLWDEVFPTPIYHGMREFSRQYLLLTYEHDDILLFLDFHISLKTLVEKSMRQRLNMIPLDMFLETFFTQIYSIRELTETEKRILARAIELGSADAQILGEELNLPRSTAYYTVSRCLSKLHLKEPKYLKVYCLGLEPILLFFLKMREEDANLIESNFRTTPYFYNSGRLITSEDERIRRDEMVLLIHLRFPGSFTYKLRNFVKTFTKKRGLHGFHWFRYDRFEHGFNLQRFGIDIQKHRTFDLRGGVVAKRANFIPGDLSILGHRLAAIIGSRSVSSLHEVERITDIKVSRSFSAEKRLFPEVIAGKDVSIVINHILPVREFRLIMKNLNSDDLKYLRTAFPEHYFYYDVNERELLVLLMVPGEQSKEIEDFVVDQANKMILYGFNHGPLSSHAFNLANLEKEYDYNFQTWKDPFRSTEWWQWMF